MNKYQNDVMSNVICTCMQDSILGPFVNNTIEWLRNYLTNRTQSTVANNVCSPTAEITQGVPQGSILGPLLYIIYANDIHNIITKSKFAFYADDTVIL